MSITDFKSAVIPSLHSFCGVPVIESDQKGKRPTGAHVTFKITSSYVKDAGKADERIVQKITGLEYNQTESFRMTISFSAIDSDQDNSVELAQKVYDWFGFHGVELLDSINVVVIERTPILNRDAFLIDDYERNNGFDVIFRLTKEMNKTVDYFDKVEVNGLTIKGGI